MGPLALLLGGGCTLPLSFQNRVDASTGGGQGGTTGVGGNGNGSGGSGIGGSGSGGSGIGGNGSGGAPIDAAVDTRDAPADLPIDTPREAPIDVPIDTPRDLPREMGVDAGPIVCTVAANCRLAGLTLTCLVAAGQPGRCVECIGNSDCASNANAKFCDPNTQRCVECLVGATDCPTSDDSHVSQCSQNHRCLNGCDDSSATPCPTKPGTVQPFCAGSGVDLCLYCTVNSQCGAGGTCLPDNVCVYCINDASCAGTPGTPLCDAIAGRCVQCHDSRDCKTAGFPLCNPSTLTCVAVP
jgi:hypothetical protein